MRVARTYNGIDRRTGYREVAGSSLTRSIVE